MLSCKDQGGPIARCAQSPSPVAAPIRIRAEGPSRASSICLPPHPGIHDTDEPIRLASQVVMSNSNFLDVSRRPPILGPV